MEERFIQWQVLVEFSKRIMMGQHVKEEDAEKVADNLVMANLRGIDSHGVARLQRYINGIKKGYIVPDAAPKVVKETVVMANVDAQNGLGQVGACYCMETAIQKAREHGIGLVTLFNSNHYGFAGYYSAMASRHDLIGVSMTNSSPLAVATYGKAAIFGTNPISVAAPAGRNKPWILDFATSVVPRGKIELYNRLGKELPEDWVIDPDGNALTHPATALRNLKEHLGGGILPIGGSGELLGGHKGYGLIVMVDILSGVLSGANYGKSVVNKIDGKPNFPRVGSLFMTINPDFFIGLKEFKERMDDYIEMIRNSEKAKGQTRIYIHGEKEFEEEQKRKRDGIPLDGKTVENLVRMSEEYGENLEFADSK